MTLLDGNRRGTLLWFDDNFIDNLFDHEIDVWTRIFGGQSDHVYRLMELNLRIVRTLDEANEALNELIEERKQGAYIFCVLDLYVPRNLLQKDSPSSTHGIKFAKRVIENKINCAFLSTAFNVRQQLYANGLESIPFFQKLQGDQHLPNALTQYILSQFRNNINWLSLKEIIESLQLQASHLSGHLRSKDFLKKISAKYFPFYGAYRDYVERTEYRPLLRRGSTAIFRCPPSHSDEFVQQCLLLQLNDWIIRFGKNSIVFRFYTSDEDRDFRKEATERTQSLMVFCLRILPEHTSPEQFEEYIRTIPTTNSLTFFILPNTEASEEFLEKAFRELRNLHYEDLPMTRIGDTHGRELLVRNAANLVSRMQTFAGVNRQRVGLGGTYLSYPRVLIHPLFWVILLEAEEVAELMSDPFEIVYELEEAFTSLLKKATPEILLCLENGEPIPTKLLLNVGEKSLKKSKSIEYEAFLERHWIPRTLNYWLTTSWQMPHGVDFVSKSSPQYIKENEQNKWEEFSIEILQVISALAKKSKMKSSLHNRVLLFFSHPAIIKTLSSRTDDVTDSEWSDLLNIKWPYEEYPLPVALNKRLIAAGRFFWVETDKYGLSNMFPNVRKSYRLLSSRLTRTALRIEHCQNLLSSLPIEWAESAHELLNLLTTGKVESEWCLNGDHIYQLLLDFAKNATPLSFIAQHLWSNKCQTQDDLIALRSQLSKMSGLGIMLAKMAHLKRSNNVPLLVPSTLFFDEFNEQCSSKTLQFLHTNKEYRNSHLKRDLPKLFLTDHLLRKTYEEGSLKIKNQILAITSWNEIPAGKVSEKKELEKLSAEQLYELAQVIIQHSRDSIEIQKSLLSSDFISTSYQILSNLICTDDLNQPDMNSYEKLIKPLLQACYQNESAFKDHIDSKSDLISGINISTPFDVFTSYLESMRTFYLVLHEYQFIDGILFLDQVRRLRNIAKERASQNVPGAFIEQLLEQFCFSLEGFAAQLQWLLRLIGEEELAANIKLCFLEPISLPQEIGSPLKSELETLFCVKRQKNEYSVYHLGIPGDESKGKLAICRQGKTVII